MGKTIPTYSLYGLEAIPADVIVQGDGVRVVERGTGRTLADVKQESGRRTPASVQLIRPNLVRRESAPAYLMTTPQGGRTDLHRGRGLILGQGGGSLPVTQILETRGRVQKPVRV